MKLSFLWVLSAVLAFGGQEIEELGALTPQTVIPLIRNTVRTDFAHYEIEAIAAQTNKITFVTTNSFLTINDFVALPSGPVLLGVKNVALDGTSSMVSVYKFTLWRGDLPAPRAFKVQVITNGWIDVLNGQNLGGSGMEDSLRSAVARTREPAPQPPPPLPPGLVAAHPVATEPPPQLPNGTNKTYSRALDEMVDTFWRMSDPTQRRSE